MSKKDEMKEGWRERLDILNDIPPRDAQRAAQTRAAFLERARRLGETVSQSPKRRPLTKGVWMPLIFGKRKERSVMVNPILALVLVLSLVFGGGGATVAAAQSSLPDQPLYGLKLWSEDARLNFTNQPESGWQVALQFAERRIAEIRAMIEAGKQPDEALQTRYEAQLEQALRFAQNLPDEQALRALEQIRERLRLQEQQMSELPANQAVVARTRSMIQQRLQWVENGLEDPQQFRQRLQQRLLQDEVPPAQPGGGNPWTDETPTPGSGYGPGGAGSGNPWTDDTPTPGSGYGPGGTGSGNPWTDDTPTPGSGYGPGGTGSGNPWTDETPTPGSGYGPGGAGSGNPWTDETPTPGSGYGPGGEDSGNPWTNETPTPGSGYGQPGGPGDTGGGGGKKP
ncbi:MAG: DUF5667 domain-containing protein [Chloroflexota bacterium]